MNSRHFTTTWTISNVYHFHIMYSLNFLLYIYFFFSHVILHLGICLEHIWNKLFYGYSSFFRFCCRLQASIKWNLSLMLYLWITATCLMLSSFLPPEAVAGKLKSLLSCYQTTEGTKHSCLPHTACLPILPPRKIYMKGGRYMYEICIHRRTVTMVYK